MRIINTSITNTELEFNVSMFDTLAFYDAEANRVAAISARSFVNKKFNDFTVITKTSDLLGLGQIKLVNIRDFIKKNPDSGIEAYAEAEHSQNPYYFDFYLTAYIILYKYYESLETLSENGLFALIDSFIDHCVCSNSDHPGTITYFSYDIHKVLKLRKSVYNMFKSHFTNYSNYYYIYMSQHVYKYTDKQFREFRNTLKDFDKNQQKLKDSSPSPDEDGDCRMSA